MTAKTELLCLLYTLAIHHGVAFSSRQLIQPQRKCFLVHFAVYLQELCVVVTQNTVRNPFVLLSKVCSCFDVVIWVSV